jgi:chloramphenicol O-acetyltransferase type A
MVMPYSVYVDHAFVDGSHLTRFFELIQEKLALV